jgi:hypothetical protein
MITAELKHKVSSIKALMDRGATQGEKDAAKAAMDRVLKANGLRYEDFFTVPPVMTRVWWRFTGPAEYELLKAAISRAVHGIAIVHRREVRRTGGSSTIKEAGVDCTASQRNEIDGAFMFAKRLYRHSLKKAQKQALNDTINSLK